MRRLGSPALPVQIFGGTHMRLEKRARTALRTGRLLASRTRAFRAAALAIVLVAGSSTGCTLVHNFGESFRYDDTWNDAASKIRNRSMSSRNWHRHKNRFCNEECLTDFCAGYRQGYEDVARGVSNGCTPNFPPRDYWGWKYQSAEGQKKVASWFSGYPHGARAAEEEGVGNWSQIQMSSNLQAQFVKAGVMPNQGHAVYPITEVRSAPAGGPTPAGNPVGADVNLTAPPMAAADAGMPVPMMATVPQMPDGTTR